VGPKFFPQPASLTFFGAQGYREIKIAADRIYHHQAGVRKEFEPTHLNSRSLGQPTHHQTSKVPGLIAKAAHGTVLA